MLLGRWVGAARIFFAMHQTSIPNHEPIILTGPIAFNRVRHSLYDFDCGKPSINKLVMEIGDFDEIYPASNEIVSVFINGTAQDLTAPIIACASGTVVTWDAVNNIRHAPRIEIGLVAVDNGFQGLHLSPAITLDVVERLYRKANARDVELRMMEVASPRARALWERSGFSIIPHTDERSPDMRMRLNPSSLARLRTMWQPRLRGGYELSTAGAAYRLKLG